MTIEFECSVCIDAKSEDSPHYAGEHPVCIQCCRESIVPQFQKALKFEHEYPVKFGDIKLDVSHFRDLLEDGFVQRFMTREDEYNTNVSDRLYCTHRIVVRGEDEDVLNAMDVDLTPLIRTEQCNNFIGSNKSADYLRCFDCTGVVCARCEGPLADGDTGTSHICETQSKDESTANFEGLQRGISFQICPHCDRRVELRDACNEMSCKCGRHFCFICGQELPTDGSTQHFVDGCPRWGPAATATANNFDRMGPAVTHDQINEGMIIHMMSNMIGEPQDFHRIMGTIVDRDILRHAAHELDELRAADIDGAGAEWRIETAFILISFARLLDLVLAATRLGVNNLDGLANQFTDIMNALGDDEFPGDRIPDDFVEENNDVYEILSETWIRQDDVFDFLGGEEFMRQVLEEHRLQTADRTEQDGDEMDTDEDEMDTDDDSDQMV